LSFNCKKAEICSTKKYGEKKDREIFTDQNRTEHNNLFYVTA